MIENFENENSTVEEATLKVVRVSSF